MAPDRPPAFEAFVAPARAKPQVWRLVISVFMIELAFLMGGILAISTDPAILTDGDAFAIGTTPATVTLLLASFIVPLAATIGLARLLHGRDAASLIGPFDGGAFIRIALLTLAILIGYEVMLWEFGSLQTSTPLPTLLIWLPVALPALVIQTGAEEVIFRGLLQTQLAARFSSAWVWMGIPATLFALGHVDFVHLVAERSWANNDGIWFAVILLMGLLAADLVRVTGSIAAAWGWHLGNNIFALLLVGYEGDLSGLALFTAPYTIDTLPIDWTMAGQFLLLEVVTWAAIRLWLATRDRPA